MGEIARGDNPVAMRVVVGSPVSVVRITYRTVRNLGAFRS